MGRLFTVEIVYRGIFRRTLAKHIRRATWRPEGPAAVLFTDRLSELKSRST